MDDLPQSLNQSRLEEYLGSVGTALRMTREHRQWSVYRLSKAAGLDERGIHRIEKGETIPSLETLLRLTVALGVRLSCIIEDAEKLIEIYDLGGDVSNGETSR